MFPGGVDNLTDPVEIFQVLHAADQFHDPGVDGRGGGLCFIRGPPDNAGNLRFLSSGLIEDLADLVPRFFILPYIFFPGFFDFIDNGVDPLRQAVDTVIVRPLRGVDRISEFQGHEDNPQIALLLRFPDKILAVIMIFDQKGGQP